MRPLVTWLGCATTSATGTLQRAGGFTVLRALATTDRFAAGASWFGIADLATFRTHTPRFQRHHTDHLVGPWPEAPRRGRRSGLVAV